MKIIKNVLYIHGFNSSGRTGNSIEKIFKEKYGEDIIVYHPSIPQNYNDARKFIDYFLSTHKVDLIIGSSLGGFMTLDSKSYPKIVINPPLNPSKILPKIGASEEVYESYIKPEAELSHKMNINPSLIIGVFGNKDNLVNSKEDFYRYSKYSAIHTYPEMEHSIKDSEISYLCNAAEQIDKTLSEMIEVFGTTDFKNIGKIF